MMKEIVLESVIVGQMFQWCPACGAELTMFAILSMKEKTDLGWKCKECRVNYNIESLKKAIFIE
jgi:transposase-like protein